MSELKPNAPWLRNYGAVPARIEYSRRTMYRELTACVEKYPDLTAYTYMGTTGSYTDLLALVDGCAASLSAVGIKEGDRVTVCMPNCPQGVAALYAINKIGAVACMIHPLSSVGEIEFYLRDSESVAAVVFVGASEKIDVAMRSYPLKTLIVSTPADELGAVKRFGYALTMGRRIKKPRPRPGVIKWQPFKALAKAVKGDVETPRDSGDPAVILYSGGTTGTSKGILLSNLNFNALGAQVLAMAQCFEPGDKMLAVMPMFHGFGLGVCIHTMLTNGGHCVLVPRFNAESYCQLIKDEHPNLIAGVPTLFEAMLHVDWDGYDLSFFKGIFSGGDSLPLDLKHRFDAFLKEHGATVKIREGYGTTECVTASCLTPYNTDKDGTIGFPFPDTFYKIVEQGTTEELPPGYDGEICISGPTVMLEYINQPQETADTLRVHADGRIWLHTGDLGMMDKDGFIYFKQRIKRMIISSGYNIYPSQIENIIDNNDMVHLSCVIGVPDKYKMQRVKAFVVLMPGVEPNDETRQKLLDYLSKNIAKYMMPKEIEFRDSLPKTLVGKVAYTVLEAQEAEKRAAEEASLSTEV